MAKDFKCAVCRKPVDRLHMRDLDGLWVCAPCIPEREIAACPGLRERLGLKPAPRRAAATAPAQPRRKAA